MAFNELTGHGGLACIMPKTCAEVAKVYEAEYGPSPFYRAGLLHEMANESLRCLGLVRSYAGPLIPMRRAGHATEVAPMMRLLTYWNSKRLLPAHRRAGRPEIGQERIDGVVVERVDLAAGELRGEQPALLAL